MGIKFDMKDLINTISTKSGLFGVFANHGFGSTTLLMQIARAVANINKGSVIVFSPEWLKEHWYERMQSIGLSTEKFVVIDDFSPKIETIKTAINNTKDVKLILIDYLELLDPEVPEELVEISKMYSLPILIGGHLARDSGDYDLNKRPELYSVPSIKHELPTSPHHVYLHLCCYDFFALLHREHDCDRGIGTAYRYNIKNTTELIVKRNCFGNLNSIFFEWNEQRKCFEL